MGELADLILDGTLCQVCMCDLGDSLGDFPQTCAGCAGEERRETKQQPRRAKPPAAADAKGNALPKWKQQAGADVSVRYHCNHCTRHFPSDDAAHQHVRDTHS